MTSLLDNKLPLVEKESNLKLFPTYAYWRMYTKYADLTSHKDRESCEISATLNIGSDGIEFDIRHTKDKIALVVKYCAQDTWLLIELILKLRIITNVIGMANITMVPMQYVELRGQQIRVHNQISYETKTYIIMFFLTKIIL